MSFKIKQEFSNAIHCDVPIEFIDNLSKVNTSMAKPKQMVVKKQHIARQRNASVCFNYKQCG